MLTSIHTGYMIIKKKGEKIMAKFKFTKSNAIVKSWVSLIVAGTYKYEDVPALFNLREIVKEVLQEQA